MRLSVPILRSFLISAFALSAAHAAPHALVGGNSGHLHLMDGENKVTTFLPFLADEAWKRFPSSSKEETAAGAPFPFVIETDANARIAGELRVNAIEGGASAVWTFSPATDVSFQALAVGLEFDLAELADGTWETDTAKGDFPKAFRGPWIFDAEARSLKVHFPDGRTLDFSFPAPVHLKMQDDRQWNQQRFTLRFGRQSGKLAEGEKLTVAMDVTGPQAEYRRELPLFMQPVTLEEGPDWIPFRNELDIEPGSALDLDFTDGPCGSKGRIIATPDGRFAYASEPGKPRRFYGVNLCFSTQFLPKAHTDRLLDRMVRLGYNSIRIHHFENQMTTPENQPGFEWDPAKVDRLDYLMAGCGKRGLWITTDLFVNRPVSGKQIGLPEVLIAPEKYKMLIPVHEAAFEDWKHFARKFLDRVNPYTGVRVADDPAVAWISLVNEGPFANYFGLARRIPEWNTAWNRWLAERFPDRAALEAAVGDLKPGESPERNSVTLPENLNATTPRARQAQAFIATMEIRTFERMRAFLRDEIGCPALLSNMNNSGSPVTLQAARAEQDYVDQHFYIDHPQFLEKHWRLPSSSANTNPIRSGAPGASGVATRRAWGKPLVVTEFAYCGPGRYRGMGGILTGAMAALQDWGGLWHFAYSHTRSNLFGSSLISYFDMAGDPLAQAADRLSLLLFLRGDMKPAPQRVALVIPETLIQSPIPGMSMIGLQSAAWNAQIGSVITRSPDAVPEGLIGIPIEIGVDKQAIFNLLEKAGVTGLPREEGGTIRSGSGELTLQPSEGLMLVDTPKSAGGYAEAGTRLDCPGAGVKIENVTTGATLFVNSLDQQPIKNSKRLLVTHLTDLQNTGIRYGEAALQTLHSWGRLPLLVRDGAATLRISLSDPSAFEVWALSPGGRRIEKVESRIEEGTLVFTATVRGASESRMLYEIHQHEPTLQP